MQNLGEARVGGGGWCVLGVSIIVNRECPYYIPPGRALWEWEE